MKNKELYYEIEQSKQDKKDKNYEREQFENYGK